MIAGKILGARTTAFLAAVLAVLAIPDIHAEDRTMAELLLSSPAFPNNGMIPSKFTCDGADASPPLAIANVPESAKALVLIVDDPDAPVGTWVHWVVWNIGAGMKEIPENSVPPGAIQGKNDFGKEGYGGPCPPSGTHRYFFRLYALDAMLPLKPGASRARVEGAMKGRVLAQAELIGLYRRK
jgi:Raf kinase inhibitor-like YbhB/YbcL family protein